MKVLVPQGLDFGAMATPANVNVVLYEPGDPWPLEHLDTTVVVVGFENAAAIGARFAPFEAEVTLVGQRARPGVHALIDIDALLPQADVVVAMLPGDASTRHVIDAEFLAKLLAGGGGGGDGTVVLTSSPH